MLCYVIVCYFMVCYVMLRYVMLCVSVLGEVQAARGFMITSIFLCGVGLLVAAIGMKCTTCLSDEKEQKNKVAVAGGVLFIIADMLLFTLCKNKPKESTQ